MGFFFDRSWRGFGAHGLSGVSESPGAGGRGRGRYTPAMTRRVYLLSPANCSGKRASYLLNPGATFELARRFHRAGLTLGEAFTFMSGLYFRGKVAYAAAYGTSPGAALVITPDRGLVPVEQVVTPADLRAMAAVPIDPAEARYNRPLVASVTELAAGLKDADEVVLLGSIATGKYVDLLKGPLGERIRRPRRHEPRRTDAALREGGAAADVCSHRCGEPPRHAATEAAAALNRTETSKFLHCDSVSLKCCN